MTDESKPAWRQVFDAWEAKAGPAIAQMAETDEFRDVVRVTARLNRDVMRELERSSTRWLHLWNLPSASDLRRLRRQLNRIEADLARLERETVRASEREAANHG